MKDANARTAFLLLVVAGMLWGTGGVLGTALGDSANLSSTAVAAYRIGLGGILLVVVARIAGAGIPSSREMWRRITVVGVLAAVFQGGYFAATVAAGVAAATLITIGSAPIAVVIVEAILARRRPEAAVLRTVAIGVVGLALLVGSPSVGDLRSTVVGAAFAVLSGGGFAGVTLVCRRPVIGLSDTAMTGWSFVVGGSILAVVATAMHPAALLPVLSGSSVLLLAAFVVIPTALAYTAFFRGLRGAAASTAAVVALLEPLVGTGLAVLLLDERLTAVGTVGAMLLLVSVVDAGVAHSRRESARRVGAATHA